ncbi:MAG: glycolate oxidase subunit GlcE [Gammaproteobacteria bacterium]|nr:glycolate oxidase subunit GlcE [Gammaproteobacteria bacterium]
MDADIGAALQNTLLEAIAQRTPLRIVGGDSKSFYGRVTQGERLSVAGHRGVVSYEPTELVITARAGTPLAEIEALLAEHGQMLPFEPPHFSAGSTLGGAIASGLSGPRRPYAGGARDFVLGVTVLTGKGEILRFGGQVMKNVAGFDVSRFLAGSLGTLGILLEVSLKVLPRPESEQTLLFESSDRDAIQCMNAWAGQSLPLSGAVFDNGWLYLRLSGSTAAVHAAGGKLGGETVTDTTTFWAEVRDHRHPFFGDGVPLWRLSLPPATPPLDLPGTWLLDWGGAQRWLKTSASAEAVRETAAKAGGHAALFRGGDRQSEVFHPLSPAVAALHKRLKAEFDPQAILNPGRMYRGL